ncbi:MAG: hypothetical protein DRH57_02450 [Candidatus Cloacimonadota bacterium]|nr:MAG: hypothetical protein DRH57_02450 [Candidatus Cloacimonadota bacterium]
MKVKNIIISTCWRLISSEEHLSNRKTFQRIDIFHKTLEFLLEKQFNKLELNAIPDLSLINMIKNDFDIVSIHNPIDMLEVSNDSYCDNISSEEKTKRELAIKRTLNTIELAENLDVQNIVLHAGSILPKKKDWQKKLLQANDSLLLNSAKEWRKKNKEPFFSNLLFSMEQILKYDFRVNISIECRNYFYEFPNPEELQKIFNEFADERLKYWHDFGHSEMQQRMGFYTHIDMLRNFKDKLSGVHIHDFHPDKLDHIAIGDGEIDFQSLWKELPDDFLPVIEVHPKVSKDKFLTSLLLATKLHKKNSTLKNAN